MHFKLKATTFGLKLQIKMIGIIIAIQGIEQV